MAWDLLPVNYTDAVWSGLKRYNMINNDDETVSFQDVTVYSAKDNSFFGAKDANRMNEALNTIMSMVESGTDLYSAFQNYFDTQKQQFESAANIKQDEFTDYLDDLKTDGDSIIESIETDYKTDINNFKSTQEQVFNTWFDMLKNTLSEDQAGNLLNLIVEVRERVDNLELSHVRNEFAAPLAVDDAYVLADDNGAAIVADWKYKEV